LEVMTLTMIAVLGCGEPCLRRALSRWPHKVLDGCRRLRLAADAQWMRRPGSSGALARCMAGPGEAAGSAASTTMR
jgi:hypothetical protein